MKNLNIKQLLREEIDKAISLDVLADQALELANGLATTDTIFAGQTAIDYSYDVARDLFSKVGLSDPPEEDLKFIADTFKNALVGAGIATKPFVRNSMQYIRNVGFPMSVE